MRKKLDALLYLFIFLFGVTIGACFIGYPFGRAHESFKLNMIWSLDDFHSSEKSLSSTKTKEEVLLQIQDRAIERYEIIKARLYFESFYSLHLMVSPDIEKAIAKSEEIKKRILDDRDKANE